MTDDDAKEAIEMLTWWRDFVRSTDDTPAQWRPDMWNQMCDLLERNGVAS